MDPLSREVRTATVRVEPAEDVLTALAGVPVPTAGGRLVLVVTAHRCVLDPARAWLATLGGLGLTPEVPHLCQPVPGLPAFDARWLDRNSAVSATGFSTVGLVLGRRIDEPVLRRARFTVVDRWSPAPHFASPLRSAVPMPVSGGGLTAADIADAFGLCVLDCRVVVEELVWSGRLSMSTDPPGTGDGSFTTSHR